jgi:NAD(P)-dependent dehydrogenase (short-subunit alcohol dehydrogenase family)
MRLQSKVVIVTGAGRGIGRATATAMIREGATVALCDRDGGLLGRTVSELGSTAAWAVEADISLPGDIEAMVPPSSPVSAASMRW